MPPGRLHAVGNPGSRNLDWKKRQVEPGAGRRQRQIHWGTEYELLLFIQNAEPEVRRWGAFRKHAWQGARQQLTKRLPANLRQINRIPNDPNNVSRRQHGSPLMDDDVVRSTAKSAFDEHKGPAAIFRRRRRLEEVAPWRLIAVQAPDDLAARTAYRNVLSRLRA